MALKKNSCRFTDYIFLAGPHLFRRLSARHFLALAVLTMSAFVVGCGDEGPEKKSPPKNISFDNLQSRVIYGDDNLKDLYEISDANILALADATVALIAEGDTRKNGRMTQIFTTPYANSNHLPLCSNEPFLTQDTAAFCSGFLVAPNIVVTAGHCVESQGTETSDCGITKFVFGFSMNSPTASVNTVPTSEVYSCKRIIHQELLDSGQDYSIVELDRPVRNHQPLTMRRQGIPRIGDELIVIGHPSGLPTKVADAAFVRSVNSAYIVASLDTYGGNSGSAVLNAVTHEVEGILVRGETDFVSSGQCLNSKRCTQSGCRGEDVTRISFVVPYVP